MTFNPLGDLIQQYMDDPKHRYPPKAADLARETGVSEQVISKWRGKPTLPSCSQLVAFSQGTGIPYERLLTAALAGRFYLPPGSIVQIPEGSDQWLDEIAQVETGLALAARRSTRRPPPTVTE